MPLPRTDAEMEIKRPYPRHRGAFTLIELLVVITIIAILMGLLFPAFRGVQDQTRRAQAKNDLTQIVTAVSAYYTEYGKYPTTSTLDVIYGAGGNPITNVGLFNVLRGLDATLNPRQIVFMSPPDVKNATQPKSGVATASTTVNGIAVAVGELVDPWGTPYIVAVDADYGNTIANPYSTNGAGSNPVRAGVLSWSRGSDQKLGLNGDSKFTNSDDVISWQ